MVYTGDIKELQQPPPPPQPQQKTTSQLPGLGQHSQDQSPQHPHPQ